MARAEISENGIKFDDDLLYKLNRAKLSASSIDKLLKCPAGWATSRDYLRPVIKEDPESPAYMGTVFHKILEIFFTKKPEDRSLELVKEIKNDVIENDFPIAKEHPKMLEFTDMLLKNYFDMGANYKSVNIATINGKKGLEYFVSTWVDNVSRPVIGFVDRIQQTKSGALFIEDYKTGKFKKAGTGQYENFDHLRQINLYAMSLRQAGYKVIGGRLIFPQSMQVENIDVDNESVQKRVIDETVRADNVLNESVKNNCFEFVPSALCSWCPFVNACPKARLINTDASTESVLKQPTVKEMKEADLL